ncbi:MAG: CoA transferase [Chloroflexi bacterium]|nr:CoA transferase [Chloroflexota bacterium]
MAGALAGLRVIEFGGFAAGPGIGKHLGNYGAEVIRIESRLRLDGFRFSYPPFKDNVPGPERAGIFNFYNDGKRSITLNLKDPRGQDLARRLVATADVVIENFTPGTLTRLGLGYATLAADNPRLIVLSTCNQGQSGPHAHHRGFGSHLTSLSGFTHLLGFPDGPPSLLYGPYIDYIAVGFGTAAVLAALYRRRRTQRGCSIDLSQYEAGLQFMTPALLDFEVNGRVAERNGNRHPQAAPHGVFACHSAAREEWVALSVMTDAEWPCFVEALGSPAPAWALDPRLRSAAGRKENEQALEAHVAKWVGERSRNEVVHTLRRNGLRVYPVNSMAELFDDPQLAARGFWRTVEHPVMGPLRVESPPALLRTTPPRQEHAAPLLGADTTRVLSDILGLAADEIDELARTGVLD